MDENKLSKLKEIKYTLAPCCGVCAYSRFEENRDFGTCTKYQYEHKKHTEKMRDLSIFKYGKCEKITTFYVTEEMDRFLLNLGIDTEKL